VPASSSRHQRRPLDEEREPDHEHPNRALLDSLKHKSDANDAVHKAFALVLRVRMKRDEEHAAAGEA